MTRELGNVLRQARQHMGLTQDKVARRMGVSRAAIGQWESGEDPSTENLIRVCEELGIELQSAIEGVLKHKDGFESVKLKPDLSGSTDPQRQPNDLERYPFNTEGFFLTNNLIPFFASSPRSDGIRITLTESPMFFAPRQPDVPYINSLYMLGVVSDNMDPVIKKLSMVYVDGEKIPTVGDIVLLRLNDPIAPTAKVTSSRTHRSQIGIMGYLDDFHPSEILLRQINPLRIVPVPLTSVAAMHTVLPPAERAS